MDHGVRAPRPPCFRARGQRLRGHAHAMGRHGFLQHQVVGGEGIRMPERAQGHVVGGPRADAGQRDPACGEILQRAFGAEVDATFEQRTRQAADRVGARAGQADRGEVDIDQPVRCREQMGQSIERNRQRRSVPLRQPRGQRARGGHAHLLADHRAHRDLETIPAARQPQPRARVQQGTQACVVAQCLRDDMRIRIQVEHAPQPLHDAQQLHGRRALQLQPQRMCAVAPRADAQPARRLGSADHAPVAALVHHFHAGQRAPAQEIQHRGKVVWRPVTQPQRHAIVRGRHVALAQFARRHAVLVAEGGVEAGQAAEAGGQRHLRDRQRGFGQQLLGEQQPARAVHVVRRGAHAFAEEPAQLPFAQAHLVGQRCERGIDQRALFDQLQGAGHRVVAAPPRAVAGRQFGPAAQAGTEARRFRRCGMAVIDDVGRLRRRGRADRPAVDARAGDGGEEQAVEARVATQPRLFADARIGQGGGIGGGHARRLAPGSHADSPFPDVNARCLSVASVRA